MSNLQAVELGGLITKPTLKRTVRQHLFPIRPDLTQKVTDKVLVKCLIYISGYIKCLQYHGIQPINTEEIGSLLDQECMDWIKDYVDGGGK